MTRGIIRFGFLPLTDAAIPIVAHEMGFAAEEGLALELSRETSWANIRDRMAVGLMQPSSGAHADCGSGLQLLPLSSSIIVPYGAWLRWQYCNGILRTEMKAHGAISGTAREMVLAQTSFTAAGARRIAEAGVWNCACLFSS
jgi:hypothetical protein